MDERNGDAGGPCDSGTAPGLHHVELWIADLAAARAEWEWFLGRLGYDLVAEWADGFSYGAGGAYVTFTVSPNLVEAPHDRRRPGLNHLAFRGTGWLENAGGFKAEIVAD